MTPMKEPSTVLASATMGVSVAPRTSSSSYASSSSSFSTTLDDNDVDVEDMEESSVFSTSPPRSSCQSGNRWSSYQSRMMSSARNESGAATAIKNRHGEHNSKRTDEQFAAAPRNRRLCFDGCMDNNGDSGHDDGDAMNCSSSGDTGTAAKPAALTSSMSLSLHQRCLSPQRRPLLKALDLNNAMKSEVGSHDDNFDGLVCSGSLYQGRKRSSAARRGEELTPKRNSNQDGNVNNGASSAAAASSEQSMFHSPHISPNSFITMDGRFVQSKNPFSSPMMTEDEGLFGPTAAAAVGRKHYHSLQHHHHMTASHNCATAPVFPASFASSSPGADSKPSSILPPRHSRPFQKRESPNSNNNHDDVSAGYPDRRFSFTGSPIFEATVSGGSDRRVGSGGGNSGSSDIMMQTDTASSGSLHKVRRLNKSDDVVAATGRHLSNRRKELQIDVKMQASDGNTADSSQEAEISPTDVLSFPPPTPVKARPSARQGYAPTIRRRPYQYYNDKPSAKKLPVETPFHDRRSRTTSSAAVAAQTPHHHGAMSLASIMNPGGEMERGVGGIGGSIRDDHEGCGAEDGSAGVACGKSRFYCDFDIIGELGKGGFGVVYKVLSRLDGCMYAIKEIQRKSRGIAERERMLKEVYALATLSDQADTATFHIVRYHQAWMEDDRLYIQTELCSGTLKDEMTKLAGALPEQRRYKLLREILLALQFLHRNGMVHLDIKPDNIFLKNDQYKLGDFGLVTKASCNDDVEEGDSRYMSRELLSGDKSDLTKSDIFSLGATMYEICLGRPLPLNGNEWQDIRSGRLHPLNNNTGPEMVVLIHRMMDPIPCNRPAVSDMLQHPRLLSDEQKALMVEKSKVMEARQAHWQQLAASANATTGPSQLGGGIGFPMGGGSSSSSLPQQQQQQPVAAHPGGGGPFPPLLRRGLMRANTWNGTTTSLPQLFQPFVNK